MIGLIVPTMVIYTVLFKLIHSLRKIVDSQNITMMRLYSMNIKILENSDWINDLLSVAIHYFTFRVLEEVVFFDFQMFW